MLRVHSCPPATMNACRILLRAGAFLVGISVLVCSAPAADDNSAGKAIYAKLCAECHGSRGEGVAGMYDEPLHGDRTLANLTKIINDTMPEGEPEKCTGEAAAQVAAYIFETFYTAEARARFQPPRIELARLTVPQYRNAAADLLAAFTGRGQVDEKRGLEGDYYNARRFQRDKRVFERVDPVIDFEFGAKSPDAEKIGVEEFAMRWQGALIVEETGNYEFCLKTENGARLWVNDDDSPLIDAWVASGGEVKEHVETISLSGGRAYPIKLDYFKYKDKSASIELQWKPPHGVWEVIPERHLSPKRVPEVLVVTTPFPADDGSMGYERGTSVSKAWHQATTYAAIEIADQVIDDLSRLAKTKPDAEDRTERLKDFCHRFAERAFRRPLTDEQKQFFIDGQFEQSDDPDAAVKRVVLLVLKSPRFLYPEIGPKDVDDYDVASRLSFGLWDSLPDDALLSAASRGELRTPEQVAQQARRMRNDPRAKAKVREFFHHWLQFDEAEEISKDAEAFPGFDDALVADLRTSLEMFIESVVWSDASDFRELLLADYLYFNDRLAEFYGVEFPAEEGFQKISCDPEERAGVVTHPYLLTAFAYHKSTSPIHRGVFATRKLLGRSLKPPPMAIQFMDGRFDPSLTMREKVAELTKSAACQTCHSVINPLGFSLEHYDAVGRFRTKENDKPINAVAEYTTLSGDSIRLTGARDLAEHAAESREAHAGFVEHLFHHLIKQPANAYGLETLERLTTTFAESEFHIQDLMVEIMKTTALEGMSPPVSTE